MGPRKWVIGQCRWRVEETPLRPLVGTVCVHLLSRKRLPCRRCGQSHWPQPRAGPPQDLRLRHSVGDRCAGRCIHPSTRLGNVPSECSAAATLQVGSVGMPLFDRPKRGRKKPHQPALAHCVRVAGQDALRLTALPRVGALNRLPDSRHAPLRRRASETPHRERPGKESAREEKERREAAPVSFFSTSKRGSIGRRSLPGAKIGSGSTGHGIAPSPPQHAKTPTPEHPNTRKLQHPTTPTP